MKATGMVRKLDSLGRIVLPKEIRQTHHMGVGAPLEIFVETNGDIILRRYDPLPNVEESADKMRALAHGMALEEKTVNKINKKLDELVSLFVENN